LTFSKFCVSGAFPKAFFPCQPLNGGVRGVENE